MDALRGIVFLLKTPKLWPLALLPVASAFVAYLVLGVLGWNIFAARFDDWARWLTIVAYIVLFPFAFYLLGSAFLGLIFEPLANATEQLLGHAPPHPTRRAGTLFADTIARLTLNAFIALTTFVLGFFVGPLAPVIAGLGAALVGLLDYTSPAFLRRSQTLGPQARQLLGKPDRHSIGFALVAGLLSVIPFVGLFCAPGLIVGGTLLARRRFTQTPPP